MGHGLLSDPLGFVRTCTPVVSVTSVVVSILGPTVPGYVVSRCARLYVRVYFFPVLGVYDGRRGTGRDGSHTLRRSTPYEVGVTVPLTGSRVCSWIPPNTGKTEGVIYRTLYRFLRRRLQGLTRPESNQSGPVRWVEVLIFGTRFSGVTLLRFRREKGSGVIGRSQNDPDQTHFSTRGEKVREFVTRGLVPL